MPGPYRHVVNGRVAGFAGTIMLESSHTGKFLDYQVWWTCENAAKVYFGTKSKEKLGNLSSWTPFASISQDFLPWKESMVPKVCARLFLDYYVDTYIFKRREGGLDVYMRTAVDGPERMWFHYVSRKATSEPSKWFMMPEPEFVAIVDKPDRTTASKR